MLILLVWAGASCASRSAVVSEPQEGGPEFDWDHWFPKAIPEKDEAAAEADLSFNPHVPRGLGVEPRIFVSPVGTAVAYVVDSPTYGRVVIVESEPDIPDPKDRYESYRRQSEQSNQPGVDGRSEVVSVRAVHALLSTSGEPPRATIEFVLDDVQITVLGPTLAKDQAVQLAGSI